MPDKQLLRLLGEDKRYILPRRGVDAHRLFVQHRLYGLPVLWASAAPYRCKDVLLPASFHLGSGMRGGALPASPCLWKRLPCGHERRQRGANDADAAGGAGACMGQGTALRRAASNARGFGRSTATRKKRAHYLKNTENARRSTAHFGKAACSWSSLPLQFDHIKSSKERN